METGRRSSNPGASQTFLSGENRRQGQQRSFIKFLQPHSQGTVWYEFILKRSGRLHQPASMAKSSARPFKVWNVDRTVKQSVTASSLKELRTKGCSKLGLSPPKLRIVLEEDGTLVDEEDYFDLLPDNYTFMFLENEEQWKPAGREETAVKDETDSAGDFSKPGDDIHFIADLIKDISNVVLLTSEQHQKLVDCKASTLAQALGQTERYVRAVQSACQRHLDEQAQADEAIELLKLYHNANNSIVDKANNYIVDNANNSIVDSYTLRSRMKDVKFGDKTLDATKKRLSRKSRPNTSPPSHRRKLMKC